MKIASNRALTSTGWRLMLSLAATLALAGCNQPTDDTAPPTPETSDTGTDEPMPSEPATDTGPPPPETSNQAPMYPPPDTGDETAPPAETGDQPPSTETDEDEGTPPPP